MPVGDASAGVPEDHQVLGLAAGDNEVGLAVAIEVGGLEVFDGDRLGRDDVRAPGLAGVVERGEQADAAFGRLGTAPADHDLVGAGAKEVGAGDGMAVLVAVEDLLALPDAGGVAGIDRGLRAVERFDGGDHRAGGQLAAAELADRLGGELRVAPLAVSIGIEPDAFLGAGEDLLARGAIPADGLEVMGDVADVVDDLGLPFVLRVGGLTVGEQLGARADAGLVADAVEGLDDEVPAAGGRFDPGHAMHGRLMVQLHRFPLLGAVGGRDEIEHRAALHRVAGIPARAHGDLGLAVAVEVLGRDADVVFLRQVLGDDVLLPRGILIPLDRGLVGQDDVLLAVAIDVVDREAVADLDLADLLRTEFGFRCGGRGFLKNRELTCGKPRRLQWLGDDINRG